MTGDRSLCVVGTGKANWLKLASSSRPPLYSLPAAKSAGKSPDEIRAAIVARILEIGPEKVSRHAADPKVLNVFDISPFAGLVHNSAIEKRDIVLRIDTLEQGGPKKPGSTSSAAAPPSSAPA